MGRALPTTDLSTYVGNEHLKTKVERFLDDGNVPHLLLYARRVERPHLLKLLLILLSVIIFTLMLRMRETLT
ncbi:MAG: hypothetical protein CM15mL4_2970 [uncultured marine virus]|nr:MAG: hypothetical protein CM15mL4_2970 [uncultured marine virus]